MGAIRTISAHAGAWGPFRDDVSVLWDWAPHDVAMCLDLVGRMPNRIEAKSQERRVLPDGLGETVSMSMEFEGDVRADIMISNMLDNKERIFSVTFEGGTLEYDGLGRGSLKRLRHSNGGGEGGEVPTCEVIAIEPRQPLE